MKDNIGRLSHVYFCGSDDTIFSLMSTCQSKPSFKDKKPA